MNISFPQETFWTASLLFFLASGALSLIFTRICISVLPLFGMVDIPHGRHQHERAVPRGGGIAIFLAFAISMLFVSFMVTGVEGEWFKGHLMLQLGPPLLLIVTLGVLDDKFELSSVAKLLVQIIAGLYFYFFGAGINTFLGITLPVWISLPVTVCWVIGIVNAFNLIDGMDGVAAGLATISAFSMAVWGVLTGVHFTTVVCLVAFCGACLGFLKFNFSPARIFMGDTGSLFLGIFFAYFSMAETSKAATLTSLLVPVLAMGIPIFDVFLAITRRLFRKYVKKEPGVGIMTGDHDHLHHRLQGQLQNPKKTAYCLYALAALLVIGSIAAALVDNLLRTLSFALLMCIIFGVIRFATIEFYDAASLISEGIRVPRKSFLLAAVHPVTDLLLLLLAYFLTSIVFQRNISFSPFSLKQALCYLAPFPLVLMISGIYKTYWTRPGISRYYRLLLMLILASVIVLALALGFILLEFGVDRDQISLMREFFTAYVFMGISFIFLERFSLHYLESYCYRKLERMASPNRSSLFTTVIYGGGLFCRMFLVAQNSATGEPQVRNVIGIIDDNPSLRGLNVYGKDVLGTSADLAALKEKYHFDEIVIALRNIPDETRVKLHAFGRANGVQVLEFRYTLK